MLKTAQWVVVEGVTVDLALFIDYLLIATKELHQSFTSRGVIM